MADHVAVQVAALAGVDLQGRYAGRADAFGVVGSLLVALDDADRHLVLEQFDGSDQQGGLASAGAGNEIEREDATFVEIASVFGGIGVIFGEDILLDLHHARLAHARHMGTGRAGTEIEIAADTVFVMVVRMLMGMFVCVAVHRAVRMRMRRSSIRVSPSPQPQTVHIA